MARSKFYKDGVDGLVQGLLDGSKYVTPGGDSPDESTAKDGDNSNGEEDYHLKRRLLRCLAIGLVTYGGSAPRSEYLMERAAQRLNVPIHIGVFPKAILLHFPGCDLARDETHWYQVHVDPDISKLQQTDELANNVGLHNTSLSKAYSQLRQIATSESPFGAGWQLFGYSISAFASVLLFYDGNLWSAAFSLPLGLGVGILNLTSSRFHALEGVQEFVSAVFTSSMARLFSMYFENLGLCYLSMAVSGLTWLLPGEELTVGISEMLEDSAVTGTSRVVQALISSLQLGFGLVVGRKMVWWDEDGVLLTECNPSGLSESWSVVWFLGFGVAMNVLLKARAWQWPGMILVGGVGLLVDKLASSQLGSSELSAVFSSFAMGITGTVYSFFSRDVPLSMTMAGIQVLLPGALGVQGVEAVMQDKVVSGVGFVLTMINICLSITIGLLLSKTVIRDSGAGFGSMLAHSRHSLATSFNEEELKQNEAEEDGHLAI